MGLSAAVISSLEGQDLCELCIVIRDENRKQSEPGAVKESSAIAKTIVLANEKSETFPEAPASRFVGVDLIQLSVPMGRCGEVATAPPRFEV